MTKRASAEQTAIGPWLLAPLLIVAGIGQGLLNNPHYVTKVMGNNAYWGFPIALILVTPAIAAIYLLGKRFPGQSIIEQGKSILGPILGTITGLLYLGFLFIFPAMVTRDSINLASMYFLFQTPVYELTLLYVLAYAWLASKGIETLTRTASIVALPALLIFLTLLIMGIRNITPNNLKPVFTPNIIDYLKAGKSALNNFYMLGLAAFMLPYLKPLNAFPRFAGGMMLLLLVITGFTAVGSIGVFGPEFILRFAYPSLAYFRVIKIPYLLLEQTGMVIGIAWLVIVLLGSGFTHYSLSLGLSQAAPFFDYKKWVWILVPFKFIAIMWPSGILQTKMVVDFVSQIGWIPLFGYPVVLYIIAFVLRKKGRSII
ncbi:MAG TPA: endospore germination permease [Bacillota bacterium]|nr:endospore germination permease [Bacillota bacterium]